MTIRQDNPRWPLEPPCACGARPHGMATRCAHAHEDPADCRTWQDTATACGWLAPVDDDPCRPPPAPWCGVVVHREDGR